MHKRGLFGSSYKRVKGKSHTVENRTVDAPTKTPCNQPAIAIVTHAQTQHTLTAQFGSRYKRVKGSSHTVENRTVVEGLPVLTDDLVPVAGGPS